MIQNKNINYCNQIEQNNNISNQQYNEKINQNMNYQQNNNQMNQNNNMINVGNNNNNNFINQINQNPNNNSINNLIPNHQNENNAPRNNLMSNQINGNNEMNNMNTQNINYMENNNANLMDNGMNLNQNNNRMNTMNNMNQNDQFNTGKNKNLNQSENSNNSNLVNNQINQNSNINNNQNSLINKKENENFIVDKGNHLNIESSEKKNYIENQSTNDLENDKNKNIFQNEEVIKKSKEIQNKITNENNNQVNNLKQNNINKDGNENTKPKELNSIQNLIVYNNEQNNNSEKDNQFPEEKDLLAEHKNEVTNNEKQTEEYFEDIYHYKKEDKIDVYFILANGEKRGVKIPSYLTRIELYFTAYFIIYKINNKKNNFSYKKLIFLYHNSEKVQYNDKKITEIKNKDEIKIEELSLFNFIYVCQPLEKDKKKHKYMNLIFFDPYNKEEKSYEFPEEITINDLMSLINFKNVDLKRAQISFENNGEILNLNDKNLKEKKLKKVFANDRKINFEIKNNISLTKYPGKILEVSLVLKGKEKKHDDLKMHLGTLEPISKFFGRLRKELDKNFPNYKEYKFFIDDNQIGLKKDDERTFSSKGVNIMSDFKCSIINNEKSFLKKVFNFK